MKDILIRSLFGSFFLLFVFIPFTLDFYLFEGKSTLFVIPLFIFAMAGIYELQRMLTTSGTTLRRAFLSYLAGGAIFLPLLASTVTYFLDIRATWVRNALDDIWPLYLLHAVLLAFFILYLFRKDETQRLFQLPSALSIGYIVLPLFLTAVTYSLTPNEDRVKLLWILLIVYSNDTFAYLSGRFFGKHKLFPSLSPKKTWEGLVGGIVVTFVLFSAFLLILGYDLNFILLQNSWLVPSTGILAVLGDLFESKLKRMTGVKDSGSLIPGHGGILDRIDAMLFTMAILYIPLALL